METFPVDVDPGQIVRWVMAENEEGLARFRIFGRRNAEPREIPVNKKFRLGDD